MTSSASERRARLAAHPETFEQRDHESIDALLDDYCVGAARPIRFH